jgi:hypothetical protein
MINTIKGLFHVTKYATVFLLFRASNVSLITTKTTTIIIIIIIYLVFQRSTRMDIELINRLQ